jgi:hypothetical protein
MNAMGLCESIKSLEPCTIYKVTGGENMGNNHWYEKIISKRGHMNKIISFILFVFCLFISGCMEFTGNVDFFTSPQFESRRESTQLRLILKTATGASSVVSKSSAAVGSLFGTVTAKSGSTQDTLNGEAQSLFAAQNLAFELGRMGFVLSEAEDSELSAYFSIGQVRFDRTNGWIADQAFLEFKDKDGILLSSYRMSSDGFVNKVNDLVRSIAKAVAETWGKPFKPNKIVW